MIKPPIKIHYGNRCYYCICRACSMRKCPWTHHKNPVRVCEHCNKKGVASPRLDCDCFEHIRYTHRYAVKKRHVKPCDVSDDIYVVAFTDVFYGPFDYDTAVKVRNQFGGVIRVLNIYDDFLPKK